MDIKKELEIGLKEIRNELGTRILFTHTNGKQYLIEDAIVFGLSTESDGKFLFTSEIQLNLLKATLVEKGYPIRGYLRANYGSKEYVLIENDYSSWDTVLNMNGTVTE